MFWDAVADLDGDGIDELWFPMARGNGTMTVVGGTAALDRVLTLDATNTGTATAVNLIARNAYVPNLFPRTSTATGAVS